MADLWWIARNNWYVVRSWYGVATGNLVELERIPNMGRYVPPVAGLNKYGESQRYPKARRPILRPQEQVNREPFIHLICSVWHEIRIA